jgi:hypothetical protein
MSFDFSELVLPEDENDFFNYDNFLSDPIYDWLNEPEAVLNACVELEKEQNQPKPKLVTIVQQAEPQRTGYYKKVSYRRGPYRKNNKREKNVKMYQKCVERQSCI